MKSYKMAWEMIGYDSISFYVFFTTIFAEIAYLFTFQSINIAITGTVILAIYLANIIICGYIQGLYEGNWPDVFVTIAYDLIFIATFVIGCMVNLKLCAIITVIPLIITIIAILMTWTDSIIDLLKRYKKLAKWIKKIENIYIIQRTGILDVPNSFIAVGVSFIIFAVMFSMVPQISVCTKVTVLILYFIFAPYFAYLEDIYATRNIFEMAYEAFDEIKMK